LQSTQVQSAQVQSGLLQLRAASPQLQFTQVHGSQVQVGFSQLVAVLMTGSPSRGLSRDYQQRLPERSATARRPPRQRGHSYFLCRPLGFHRLEANTLAGFSEYPS
jgi:hypothetical protein